MHSGKTLRLSRIFDPQSGRGIVVAFDHGLFLGPTPGLEDVRNAIAQVREGKPDALQVTPGIAIAAQASFLGAQAPALIVRVDATNTWRTTAKPRVPYRVQVASVEDAVRLGADAVVAFLFTGFADDMEERANLEAIGTLVSACREWGMPLMLEPLAIALGQHLVNLPEVVALMARMACELGADVVKVDYTGSAATFARVIQACTVPVLVRGGPKMATTEQALGMVADALEAGAHGIVFGRNIWQHANPAGMVRALRQLIHHGQPVGTAMRELST